MDISLTRADKIRFLSGGFLMEEWLCETCIYYPPSCLSGKPCCFCEPDEPILSCYSERKD